MTMSTVAPEPEQEHGATHELPGWARLWFGVAGGQAAWGLAVLVAYPTVAAVCQAHGSALLVHAVRWVAGAIAITATLVSHGNWRTAEKARDAPRQAAQRASFMGFVGMLLSGAGVLLLFVEDLATWVIDPCL